MRSRRKYGFLIFFFIGSSSVFLISVNHQLIESNGPTEEVVYQSAFCQCNRTIPSESYSNGSRIHWCSEETSLRGYHQNVVSYSVYGDAGNDPDSNRYYALIITIPQQAQLYYPGWRVRYYHGLQDNREKERRILCDAYCNYSNVDLCDVNDIIRSLVVNGTDNTEVPVLPEELGHWNKMNWRYLPMLDEQVDRMLARDTDSEINSREAAAVNQWLASDFTFHVMRDHPDHSLPIMGGMFGVKVNQRRVLVDVLTRAMVWMGTKEAYGEDQNLLAKLFWPRVKYDAVIHDSYHCEIDWGSVPSMPFPTRRIPNTTFATDRNGSENDWPRPGPCPAACRPSNHPDWEFC